MLRMAAKSPTGGIDFPSAKTTRAEIVGLMVDYLRETKKALAVSVMHNFLRFHLSSV
jgi:hypothetical protein